MDRRLEQEDWTGRIVFWGVVGQDWVMEDVAKQPVVREVVCKTVLNRSAISDYSLNCYGGCTHACVYCYARFMERFHPHTEEWGGFVDVKANAVEALEKQLHPVRGKGLPPGDVFVSSACDAWQPIEAERKLTRECCRLLLENGFRVNALTKSRLVLRDLDIFAGRNGQIGTTLTSLDPALAALWEPGASTIEERLSILREARAAGIDTSVMFGPLLPFLSDDQRSVDGLFEQAATLRGDKIWGDAMNPRPKVLQSVKELFGARYPQLEEGYEAVLHWPKVREAYLKGIRERVERATRKYGLEGRVSGC
jgi:DNA repair photolyase